MKKQKILITGSEGLLGKLTRNVLEKEGHKLVLIDKVGKNSRDILTEDINPYFRRVETVIHFAANPQPWIDYEKARKNVDIIWKVLEACRTEGARRIVNASSVNVYDIKILYEQKKTINEKTPLSPNSRMKWKCGKDGGIFYGISKIIGENLVKSYHQSFGISGLNLRFGCITPDDRPSLYEAEDNAIWLSHKDFEEIIKRAIYFNGFENLVCTSRNSEKFADLRLMKKVLDYEPKSNSANLK